MKGIIEYTSEELLPDINIILKRQGIPSGKNQNARIIDLANEALATFEDMCEASGVIADVSIEEFEDIYGGEGLNADETPVGKIFPRADHLALFAITVGDTVSDEISSLFDSKDFALASILDTVASEATEKAGAIAEERYFKQLLEENRMPMELAVMRYSPGYCGWHISGQKKLFEFLEPEEIGISLNDSYLMQPLKSISGVMIVGRPEIHRFDSIYPFCDNCLTKDCQDRIASILSR